MWLSLSLIYSQIFLSYLVFPDCHK
jgi:hypothetical protein